MAEDWLSSMEQRLDELEKRVFGASDKEVNYPKDHYVLQMIDTVVNLNSQVDKAVAARPKLERTMGKLNALDKFMDPEYADSLTLSRAAKAEIILSEEEELKKQAENLQKMQSMMEVLSSEHIKAVPSLQIKLQEISTKQIEQQDEASELCDKTKDLFAYYNNVITLLSKHFVQWDELVTKAEMASQVKKVDQ